MQVLLQLTCSQQYGSQGNGGEAVRCLLQSYSLDAAVKRTLQGSDSSPRDRAAVLAFTEVMADRDMHGKYSLELYDTGRYMRLDAAAQRALNVLKSKTDANDNFSLYGLLNRARTAMGKRLLKAR